ncbi:MAG: SDR family oxidoreductase [Candidatus Methylomirabilales bacterium]
MVTGASAGIGRATALGLAKMGASVVMVCRNRERGEAALTEIKRESGNTALSLLLADLSSQAAIRQLAEHFKAQYPTLHVLINNAGIITKRRILTEDKLETQFAVNHLAYFLLTNLLLDTLKASAPARIINISSRAHQGVSIDFDDLQSEQSYRRIHVYAWTKLANVLFTYELSRRLKGTQVTANCLHPGVIATNLVGDYMPRPLRFMTKIIGASPEKGAHTPLYLATSSEVEGVSGKYFVNQKAVPSSPASYDRTTASRLWQVSAELTGLF